MIIEIIVERFLLLFTNGNRKSEQQNAFGSVVQI